MSLTNNTPINLSDDLINNFENSIKSFISYLIQDPISGSSSSVLPISSCYNVHHISNPSSASSSSSEQNVLAIENYTRRIHESANEIECNLLQLKCLVHKKWPDEQVLETITDLKYNIERKESLLKDFQQHLNDSIGDFSVENTESLNGLLEELSRGAGTGGSLGGVLGSDLQSSLSPQQQATTSGDFQRQQRYNDITSMLTSSSTMDGMSNTTINDPLRQLLS
ncbi:unnamed protein product [Didymodactylos carnosus]|uniref:Uncharacterized protein n=1 Tax=Didymodactylos carnosus TaxID=1234261 RepID=A0A813T6E5_9BILA|nr:unnamed protein product [Didymodactylos carnosus]CAF0848351.1 unnamed protein product [Didymodactylos carnosus]CAF3592834.1 unnamed protein product [Didymodactylos carnosus]CAF3633687.1 unnamed protein product [Didymodactylos carnosus]